MVNEETLDIKLIDFDLSQTIDQGNRGMSMLKIGTSLYFPPEILERKEYSMEKAAVWQLGVVLYLLLSSYFPFDSDDEVLTVDIKSKIHEMIDEYYPFENEDKIYVLESMLSKDPTSRPTLDEIISYFK